MAIDDSSAESASNDFDGLRDGCGCGVGGGAPKPFDSGCCFGERALRLGRRPSGPPLLLPPLPAPRCAAAAMSGRAGSMAAQLAEHDAFAQIDAPECHVAAAPTADGADAPPHAPQAHARRGAEVEASGGSEAAAPAAAVAEGALVWVFGEDQADAPHSTCRLPLAAPPDAAAETVAVVDCDFVRARPRRCVSGAGPEPAARGGGALADEDVDTAAATAAATARDSAEATPQRPRRGAAAGAAADAGVLMRSDGSTDDDGAVAGDAAAAADVTWRDGADRLRATPEGKPIWVEHGRLAMAAAAFLPPLPTLQPVRLLIV
eukprot:234762-Chlamydomonas_euryale.AAC.3